MLARDLIKSIGCFTSPSRVEMWKRFIKKFEKATERHHLDDVRWAEVIPEMLKGEAKVHFDTEVDSLCRNLTYTEVVDLLMWIYHEFDVQMRASEELSSRVQLEGEGITAFTSAIKCLAARAYPESEEIRMRTVRE